MRLSLLFVVAVFHSHASAFNPIQMAQDLTHLQQIADIGGHSYLLNSLSIATAAALPTAAVVEAPSVLSSLPISAAVFTPELLAAKINALSDGSVPLLKVADIVGPAINDALENFNGLFTKVADYVMPALNRASKSFNSQLAGKGVELQTNTEATIAFFKQNTGPAVSRAVSAFNSQLGAKGSELQTNTGAIVGSVVDVAGRIGNRLLDSTIDTLKIKEISAAVNSVKVPLAMDVVKLPDLSAIITSIPSISSDSSGTGGGGGSALIAIPAIDIDAGKFFAENSKLLTEALENLAENAPTAVSRAGSSFATQLGEKGAVLGNNLLYLVPGPEVGRVGSAFTSSLASGVKISASVISTAPDKAAETLVQINGLVAQISVLVGEGGKTAGYVADIVVPAVSKATSSFSTQLGSQGAILQTNTASAIAAAPAWLAEYKTKINALSDGSVPLFKMADIVGPTSNDALENFNGLFTKVADYVMPALNRASKSFNSQLAGKGVELQTNTEATIAFFKQNTGPAVSRAVSAFNSQLGAKGSELQTNTGAIVGSVVDVAGRIGNRLLDGTIDTLKIKEINAAVNSVKVPLAVDVVKLPDLSIFVSGMESVAKEAGEISSYATDFVGKNVDL